MKNVLCRVNKILVISMFHFCKQLYKLVNFKLGTGISKTKERDMPQV